MGTMPFAATGTHILSHFTNEGVYLDVSVCIKQSQMFVTHHGELLIDPWSEDNTRDEG